MESSKNIKKTHGVRDSHSSALAMSIIEQCAHISNIHDLRDLLGGCLKELFSFEIACCGLGSTQSYQILDYLNMGFPDSWIKRVVNEDGRFYCPVAKKWISLQRPYFINNVTELQGLEPQWVSDAQKHNIKNMLVHGLTDIAGDLTSLILFVNHRNGWTLEHSHTINLLIPHLHIAMRQVFLIKKEVKKVELFTSREMDILRWIYYGKTNIQIAELLGIQHNTVRNHVQNIYEKLGVHNRIQAVTKAVSLRALELTTTNV